jgi:DNA processing protein
LAGSELSFSLVGWVALCLVPRIGGRTLSALLRAFGSPRAIFDASDEELRAVKQIGARTVEAIQAIDLEAVEAQIRAWHSQDVTLLTWQDDAYPAPFIDLHSRPPLLFARGKLTQDWTRVVGIVGAREASDSSLQMAESLARELTARGWLVASGLARGIDAAAHRGALVSGHTVAVLGCGVDEIYPVRNRTLAENIMHAGAIYAEVPPGTMPSPGSLMARNRLISGLSKAVIVVQAGLSSGSMEAARRARQQQRHVLTIDDEEFEGNQALLRMDGIPLAPDFSDWDGLAVLLDELPDPPRQLSFFDGPDGPQQLNLFD